VYGNGFFQAHQEILMKLVDLIGITSIMEILVRLVGADEHIYAFHVDSLQWLADTDLLEMLVDKLSPLVFLVRTSCSKPTQNT
jgi:serine/threonine-protein phosphatase 6 regulatory subunit 3